MVPSFSLPFHMAYVSDHINFHDGGRCHIETSPLICKANQWTGFYMITASVTKELNIGYFDSLLTHVPFA